jgi:hypothetical protein
MNIEIKILKEIADTEFINPEWGITQQFLEVNKIKKINNEYVYDRYSIENQNITFHDNKNKKIIEKDYYEIVFYYEIEKKKYFYCIGVDIEKKEIARVFMVNSNKCYLTATSEQLTLKELSEMTKLKYTSGWSKGDKRRNGSVYDFSRINFEFYEKTSYELEEILPLILDELEKDIEGIKKLVRESCAYISICKYQYISANAGIHIDEKTIERLNKFNLSLDIDMYISGERFKS